MINNVSNKREGTNLGRNGYKSLNVMSGSPMSQLATIAWCDADCVKSINVRSGGCFNLNNHIKSAAHKKA